MLKNYGWDADRDPAVIHPSEMAKPDWCLRATYFRIANREWPDKEKFDFFRENIFATGNDIHTKWQGRIIDAGFPMWGDWECSICDVMVRASLKPSAKYGECIDYHGGHRWEYAEVTLNARSELLIAGHSDGGFGDTLVEIKSIGLGTLRLDSPTLLSRHQDSGSTHLGKLWRDIRKPLKSHLIQGDVYCHLAHVLGLPFTRIVYLYEFKPNQLTKEFVINYDPERVKPLIAKAEVVKYAVEHGEPPACNNASGGCSQCKPYERRRRTVAGRRSE